MEIFEATMMAEGASGYEAKSLEEYLEAYQLLVDTGTVWELQGFFGRTANDLIDQGLLEVK